MKPYNQYKYSGIEWLGDIPEHWEVKKLKYLGKSIIGLTYSPDDISYDGSGILVLRSSNIQKGKLCLEDTVCVNLKIDEKLITQVGDILICSRNGSADLVGKNILISEKLAGQTFGAFMTVFRSPHFNYIYWFLNSIFFEAQKGLFSTATINQLTSGILDNLLIALPPSKEQTKISNYLSKKTAEIDSSISDKEQLIALYEEEKKAFINEAVTKGLNPSVCLKPSGTDWLGKIPEHWEVKKLKYLGESIIGLTYSPEDISFEGKGSLVLRSSNIQKGKLSLEDTVYVNVEIDNKLLTQTGDILICSRNGSADLVGKNILIDEELAGQTFGAFMTIFRSPYSDYAYWFFNSIFFEAQRGLFSTSTINQLTSGILNNLLIALPPAEEQLEIVRHIQTKTQQINQNIQLIQQEINLLKEYKQALIFEAVTGKIDLRHTAAAQQN